MAGLASDSDIRLMLAALTRGKSARYIVEVWALRE
jgi:hypothetical protein